MPRLLTTNAIIRCPHGGTGTTTPANPILNIAGGLGLADGDTGTIAGCALTIYPCVSYVLRSMGLNATKIGSKLAILETDFNLTNTFQPLTMSDTHNFMDSSSPSPLPLGQSEPVVSPPMQDVTPPVVTLTPPAAAFSNAAPAPVTLTGTLTAAFPLARRLTYLNLTPPGGRADWTGGEPTGTTVSPSGGTWSSSPLTVTITLTPAYLASLPIGAHRIVLIGVSQRGKSAFAECNLTIS